MKRLLFAAALLCLVVPIHGFSQTINATLGGTVSDPSGALIPGVTITATNAATGIVTSALTLPIPLSAKPLEPVGLTDRSQSWSGYDSNWRTPYMQSFNVSLTHDILGLKWIEGPGNIGLDMNLTKRVKITESKEFELRVDASNVLNHPNFAAPVAANLSINSNNTFGRITTASGARSFVINSRFNF